MKKFFIIYTLIMSALVACNSSRHTGLITDECLTVKSSKIYDDYKTRQVQSNYQSFRIDSVWHNTLMKIRIYDTSKYDSASKTSPLLAEGCIVNTSSAIEKEQDESVFEDKEDEDIIAIEDATEDQESHIISTEKRSICTRSQWLLLIGLMLATLAGIIWLNWPKYKKKSSL